MEKKSQKAGFLNFRDRFMIGYVNGKKIHKREDALISAFDLGFSRSYAAYEYLRTYGKQPFHIDDHLARLSYSLHELEIPLSISLSELKEKILELVEEAPFSDASIRIYVTGGESTDGMLPNSTGSWMIFLTPLSKLPSTWYEVGMKAILSTANRNFPHCKTNSYLEAVLAMKRAKKQGAEESFYCTPQGELLEGTTTNIFAFKQNRLITSDSKQILFGVTRGIILRLAAPHFAIEKRSILLNEIQEIDELFITSTTKQLVPVVKVENFTIGNGKPGKQTQFLHKLFKDYVMSMQTEMSLN
ncbi:MAG: aminotransferase class IV [Chlamydiae bacterium]|nr:aminotransferase class IV [Chlamydiota bacterium]